MTNHHQIVGRRAELLVEAFLTELKPAFFVGVEGQNLPFDFMIAFKGPNQSLIHFAIEVKATEKEIPKTYYFHASKRSFESLTKSNLPTILLIADVKMNEIYYGFGTQAELVKNTNSTGFFRVALLVKKVDPNSKEQFVQEMLAYAHK